MAKRRVIGAGSNNAAVMTPAQFEAEKKKALDAQGEYVAWEEQFKNDKGQVDFSNMSLDDLSRWIQSNPSRFEDMDQGEFETWVQDSWGQYQVGVFGESPQYEIPQAVFDQLNLYRETAITGIKSAQAVRESTMGGLREGVEGSINEVRGARDEALGIAREDIDRIRDIQGRSRDAALDQAYAGRREMLAELQRGGDRALDIQRLQAFGGLPGERMTREQMQSNFAATQQAIKERAGGGSAALGAIAQGYTGQVAGERQLAVDRAQYQAQGMANLAQGEFQQSGRMADAMRQSRLDIAGTEMATANNMSDAYLATSQYYTGQVGGYARDIANAQFRGAQAVSSMDYATGQNVVDQMYRGAGMIGEGLQNVAGQQQQQFAINQYEPYVAQRQFLLNELQRLDPWGSEMQMYGDLMGQGYSQYMQGVSGQAQGNTNMGNIWANTAATAGAGEWDFSGGGNNQENNNSWINPSPASTPQVSYGSPVYDDPWENK